MIIGAALSRSINNVDSKNTASKSATETNTNQGTFYATGSKDNFFYEGLFSYGISENEGTRHVVVGGVDRIASSSYDSQLMSTRLTMGKDIKKSGLTITPKASFTYSVLSTDKYTETGAGSMNLTVENEDLTKSELEIELGFSKKLYVNTNGTLTPDLSLGFKYEVGDTFNTSTSTFEGGGDAFKTNGIEGEELTTTLGLGLSYKTADKMTEIRFDYDLGLKDGYVSNVGMLTARFKF